jgi:hypothetical protein
MNNSFVVAARETFNANRARTSGVSDLQSSLRDYDFFSLSSRHCAALRAGLITIAAPRLNEAVQSSGRPEQGGHTKSRGSIPGAKALEKATLLFAGLKPEISWNAYVAAEAATYKARESENDAN